MTQCAGWLRKMNVYATFNANSIAKTAHRRPLAIERAVRNVMAQGSVNAERVMIGANTSGDEV